MKKSTVLILYSAGMDSTAVTVLLSKQFSKIRLLTCKTPYILGPRLLTEPRIRDMRKALPDVEISVSYAKTGKLLHSFKPIQAAIEARSTFHLCTVCKISMHLTAIQTCLREGISYASNGIGVREQQGYPDQLPELEERVEKLYARAQIERISPLATLDKNDVKNILIPLGLYPSKMAPRCLIAPIQGICWHFGDGPPPKQPILDWYDKHLPEMEKMVDEWMGGS